MGPNLRSIFTASLFVGIAVSLILTMPLANVSRNSTAIGLLLFSLALSGWQLTLTATGARVAATTMMVHLFFVFFLIVPALFQLVTQTYALDMSVYSNETAAKAAAIVLIFIIFFMAGGALGPSGLGRATRTIYSCERRRRGLVVIAYVLLAATVTLMAILILGVDTLVANRTDLYGRVGEQETTATLGLYLSMPRALSFCGVLAVLYLFGRRLGAAGTRRNSAIVLGLIIIPLFGVVNYPLGLPRFWLFGMMIAVFLLYCDLRSITNRLLLIAGIGGGVYTVFPLSRRLTTADPAPGFASLSHELVTSNFDGFEMIMNMVIVVERFGYTFGHQLASAVLFFVPRSWWEGKALASGHYTAEKLGYAFTNLSAPAPGELYLDFSYVGVIIGALAIGYVYRKADTLYAASLSIGGVSLHRIQASLLAGFTIILMRGSLLAVISLIASSFGSIWLLMAAPKMAGFFTSHSGARRDRHVAC